MRLLFAAVSDFKPRIGGVAELTHNLAASLCRRGHEVIVAARLQSGDNVYDSSAPFNVVRMPFKYRNNGLRSLVLARRPEAVIVNVLGGGWGACRIATKRLGIPLVLLAHGQEISPGGKMISRIKTRYALMSSDIVVCNSRYTAELAMAGGARSPRCVVVNPGVDVETAVDAPIAPSLQLEQTLRGKKVILSLSRLIRRKGFDTAIRAIAPILSSRNDVVYVIAGEGAVADDLKRLAQELGVENKVVFTGAVDAGTKRWLMQRQALFLMPNRLLSNGDVEGFGIVFLEANLAGKPVIGGDSGGVPDAIDDGKSGFLVNPEDLDSIRGAVNKLLDDPGTAACMGSYGRARVLANFSWDSRAENFERILGSFGVKEQAL